MKLCLYYCTWATKHRQALASGHKDVAVFEPADMCLFHVDTQL